MSIATSSAYTNVEALLDNNLPAGWRDWFTAIASCDQVTAKKPSPAVYNAVIEQMGLPLDSIIALEDTPNGSARRPCCGDHHGGHHPSLYQRAVF